MALGDKIITLDNLDAFKGEADSAYAASTGSTGTAARTAGILYGAVDSTSTATVYTATVPGLTELVDGTCVMLHNGVVTSAAGFTVEVNNLGAKKCYNNMTNATQDTTIFNAAYTMLFVYSEDLDEGNGGWWIYRGYDGNTNTIGYQLRTNSGNKVAADTGYRYRIWLTSADGLKWVPINTSSSTNATSNRSLNTRAIDPFGPIIYRPTNGTCNSGTGLGATGIWQQYTLTIGYSYMASGFSLTFPAPVYLRCTPQTDGSAKMQDIVQTLPSSKDGKIYIHLGTAYSATGMELQTEHPVYWHDGTGIRIWTGAEASGGPSPSSTTPSMDGTAAVGTSTDYARADHVHPTDTGRAAATHTHGDITSDGDITATAPTVASGDKLIINDESASKVTNGPSFGSSTTTYLRNDGTWGTPAGSYSLPTASTSQLGGVKVDGTTITIADGVISSAGGGGGVSMSTATASLATSGWSNNSMTVSVTGVTASNNVIVTPAPASASAWAAAGIVCTAQGAGTLTFTRTSANTSVLRANVLILS